MSTHTPGPWLTSTDRDEVVVHAGKFDYLPACTKGGTLEEWQANARLISAAPDLLAALREIDTIVNESASECRKRMGTRLGNIMVAARAAIQKAEGNG